MTSTNKQLPSQCGVLRIRPGAKYIAMSVSGYYDGINEKSPRYDPNLPRPIHLGARARGLLIAELDAYLAEKVAERDMKNRPCRLEPTDTSNVENLCTAIMQIDERLLNTAPMVSTKVG